MRPRVLAACLCAPLLGACAGGLTSTLPASSAAVSVIGLPTTMLAPAAVDPYGTQLQALIEQRVMKGAWGIPLQLGRGTQGLIRLRVGADESFEADSAQLRPAALLLYAEIADVLKRSPATVTHVLAHAEAEGSAELSTDLTSRRAASVLNYFLARGIPSTRLRAEGRGARELVTPAKDAPSAALDRRLELVLKPVIAGREAEAWTPPPPAADVLRALPAGPP